MNQVKMNTLRQDHDGLNARMSALGINPSISIADRHGIGLLVHADFDASEGEYARAPCLMLNLCTAYSGRMRRVGDGPRLDGVLRPGTVAIALPNTAASGYWSKTQMLGIAVNLDMLGADSEDAVTGDCLQAAASELHNDPLLTVVMTALWRDAEAHGLSGAFFEHGINVLLKRLASYRNQPKEQARPPALRGRRLQQVLDLLESRLSEDVRVSELAALAGQDVRTFTRSFCAATGVTPYAYFTLRRMELAKRLLRDAALSITEIALHVGYTNPSKFSAAFRRLNGIAPGNWRRAQYE